MKKLIYLILISSLINAAEGQALRALHKDDQHHWIAQLPAQPNRCGICLQSEGSMQSLSCHKEHRFHCDCIEEWKRVNNSCPLCHAIINDSAVCNCIKSYTRAGVFCPVLMGLGYALIKSGERILEYACLVESASPDCNQHCAGCSSLCVYCTAGIALGSSLYFIKNYKRD